MAVKKLQWNNLLHLTELKFEPEEPKQLTVNDEIMLAISWLTAATKHDRKLLRCDENGALLMSAPWSLLTAVESGYVSYATGDPNTFTATTPNKGALCAIGLVPCIVTFVQINGGAEEIIFLPANCLYWYSHTVYSVTYGVMYVGGDTGHGGVTTFN